MIAILVAAAVSLLLTIGFTPVYARFLERKKLGQHIRVDGPISHLAKSGTPTMGGVVFLFASAIAYFVAHLVSGTIPTASGLWVLYLILGFGVVGFMDDFMKFRRKQSEGLTERQKIFAQVLVSSGFAVGVMFRPDEQGLTPASTYVSFVRDTPFSLAVGGVVVTWILWLIWANLISAAWSNGVNLTDGLDGLAAGISSTVFGAFVLIGWWQWRQSCLNELIENRAACYSTRDPLDTAILAAALSSACIGFLWWNTSKARIFMGDTGSLALGGGVAGLSIVSHTQLLTVIMGGMFVLITLSVVIQVGVFKATKGRKRVFRMAPLQHHFEQLEWPEVTVVVRFWIISLICVGAGLGIFYLEWTLHAL